MTVMTQLSCVTGVYWTVRQSGLPRSMVSKLPDCHQIKYFWIKYVIYYAFYVFYLQAIFQTMNNSYIPNYILSNKYCHKYFVITLYVMNYDDVDKILIGIRA